MYIFVYSFIHSVGSFFVSLCMINVIVFLGDMYEIGAESGRYYSLNVPLREGMDDNSK